MKLVKYSSTDIRTEAQLFLGGKSIPTIASILNIPVSTVSWHLIHPLKDIDYTAWIAIRYKLLNRAVNKDRQEREELAISFSGVSIDNLSAQWEEIDKLRREDQKRRRKK